MSYSQLYVINKELKVAYIEEFQNSWLFPIPIFRYLINKYSSEEEKESARKFAKDFDGFDYEKPINPITFFMFDTNNEKFNAVNSAINNSEDLIDRIGWELVNQQMFYSKNKEIITNAINKLQKLCNGDEKRFAEVAKEINEINIEKNPFFIFKNNTIDDGVEKYFSIYDDEADDEKEISLKEYPGELNFDLVSIENNTMYFEKPITGMRK